MALAIAISLLAVVGLEGSAARAADAGELDRSFGTNGRTTVNFGDLEVAWDLAFQGPRHPIVAGWTLVETGSCCDAERINVALARLRSGGRLDSGFGRGGTARTRSGDRTAYAVAVQDTGKILVAGGGCYLMRYKPDGTLDQRFGRGGIAQPNLDPDMQLRCRSLALQDNGRAVVAGHGYTPSTGNQPILLRYRRGGSLDESFAADGKAIGGLPGTMTVDDLLIQPDGGIVVAGGSSLGDFSVARYTSQGEPDPSFSGDGLAATDIAGTGDVSGVALSEEGLVISGTRLTPGSYDFALARFDLNGNLDLDFGEGGIQTTDFRQGGDDDAWGIAAQADGKVVLAGSTDSPGKSQDFALARYLPDGTLDPSFSRNGKAVTAFKRSRRGARDVAYGVAVDRHERILAVGSSGKDFAVARYHGG